ncbi:MAG: hypothetical protein LBS96_09210 [Oscillospiraceae bacterium]|nr:hypothetical protein [Oscillospiraceae bacterium]
MKRSLALGFVALFFCAALASCGGQGDAPTNAPPHVPYEPIPPASTAAVSSSATVRTSRDLSRIPIAENYPEEITLRFTRAGTPVSMTATRSTSAQTYVIYLPEEYAFFFLPGPPDMYRPDSEKYPSAQFSLWVSEVAADSPVPPKTTQDGQCREYRHVTVGGRAFELQLNYPLAEAETIRPLLMAMADTIRI